ncbi:MAG: GNAT family N-acetyltransferase, partial [Actinoplanes sp.]
MSARPATVADTDELVRLRAVLLRSMGSDTWDDDWREPARQAFRDRLAEPTPTLAAFVVDRPVVDPAGVDGPGGRGLAACAVGTIEHRLGSPGDPDGRAGYVFSVATDPDSRRRGYSRDCVTA